LLYIYLSGLIVALGAGFVCWMALRIILKSHLSLLALDVPNQRSLHSEPIPRGGGMVIAGVLVVTSVGLMPFFSGLERDLMAFGIGAAVLGILGWLDDQGSIRIDTKLLVECAVSIIALWLIKPGVNIQLFSDKFVELTALIAFPITVIGLVWITNVYNFMDGIDGLVTSQTILSSIVIAGWFTFYGDVGVALFCLALGGAAAGFLIFNWSPAKIFLGDAGSLSLGTVLGLLAVYGILVHQIPVTGFVLLYGIFLSDTLVTMIRRILNGERWWEGHSTHFYQRLVRTGVSHRRVCVLAIFGSSGLAIFGTLEIFSVGHGLLWLSLGLLVMFVMMMIVHIRETRLRAS